MEEHERRQLDDAMLHAPTPITPPEDMKAAIFERIRDTPQPASMDSARRRRGVATRAAAVAASVVLLAGGGFVVTQRLVPPASDSVADGPDGAAQMHAIMEAPDLRTADARAMGARLSIVVSTDMGKGGAMVDGQPELGDGMGAQVWAVMADGSTKSAGVIGQEPHEDVWMPLPGETMSVMITEEPAAGMPQPTGRVLATVDVRR